ncbi:MAG: hypothetical protein MUP94_02740 [Flavobacteriales bacterium]|nr:hypothetical protein [Flavobacteriales bacterium]
MAKRSLGEAFLRAMVRQVGRDAGKVVSNQAFGDAHSTPIRMVRSADTSQQYAGKRRSYRHDLDRVVNGDLPSTVGSAKKKLVELENAMEDFLGDLMPISSPREIQVMKSWMYKSRDFIEDVLKIVDKPDVKKLADELLESFDDIKDQAKKRAAELELPVHYESPSSIKNARAKTWIGLLAAFGGAVALASLTVGDGFNKIVPFVALAIVTGVVLMIMGAVEKSAVNTKRSEHKSHVARVLEMKEALGSW